MLDKKLKHAGEMETNAGKVRKKCRFEKVETVCDDPFLVEPLENVIPASSAPRGQLS